jgi:hypothetical protein
MKPWGEGVCQLDVPMGAKVESNFPEKAGLSYGAWEDVDRSRSDMERMDYYADGACETGGRSYGVGDGICPGEPFHTESAVSLQECAGICRDPGARAALNMPDRPNHICTEYSYDEDVKVCFLFRAANVCDDNVLVPRPATTTYSAALNWDGLVSSAAPHCPAGACTRNLFRVGAGVEYLGLTLQALH